MKDIVITSQKIKRERNIYLVCLLAAVAINIGAIIAYERPWMEMFTQIGYVFVVSLFIYLILCLVRLAVYALCCLWRKRKCISNKK